MKTKAAHTPGWLLVIAGTGLAAATARAHPLGNASVNQSSDLAFSGNAVEVGYVLDLAEIPSVSAFRRLDADGDGEASPLERQAWLDQTAAELARGLDLWVSGVRLRLRPTSSELELSEGEGGLPLLRVALSLRAEVPAPRRRGELRYEDRNHEGRPGWKEVAYVVGDGVRLLDAEGASDTDSAGLPAYAPGLLGGPPADRRLRLRFELAPGEAATGGSRLRGPPARSGEDGLGALIRREDLGPASVLLVLLIAFGLGALHSLSPGHGKTVVAAYLVGSRGTVGHAALLGLVVTATHVSSVLVLGALALWASEHVVPDRLYPWLGLASGLLIVVIGVWTLPSRLRAAQARDHGHGHGHGHDHGHDHRDTDGHPVSLSSLLVLGVTGGLVPCPSAVVVLLSAVALHRIALGLLLILAFSAGLAAVLIALGVAVVRARDLVARAADRPRWVDRLPVASSVVVTLLGLGIALSALRGL